MHRKHVQYTSTQYHNGTTAKSTHRDFGGLGGATIVADSSSYCGTGGGALFHVVEGVSSCLGGLGGRISGTGEEVSTLSSKSKSDDFGGSGGGGALLCLYELEGTASMLT